MTNFQNVLAQRIAAKKGKKNGFTLIELMVVVAIVGVLTAVGLPQLTKAQDRAKDSAAVATLTNASKECSLELISGVAGYEFADPGVFDAVVTLDSDGNTSATGCVKDGILKLNSESGDNGFGGAAGTRATVTFTGGVPGAVQLEAIPA